MNIYRVGAASLWSGATLRSAAARDSGPSDPQARAPRRGGPRQPLNNG